MSSDFLPQRRKRPRPASALSSEEFFRTVVFREENQREQAQEGITAPSNTPEYWKQLFDGPDKKRVMDTEETKSNSLPTPNAIKAPDSLQPTLTTLPAKDTQMNNLATRNRPAIAHPPENKAPARPTPFGAPAASSSVGTPAPSSPSTVQATPKPTDQPKSTAPKKAKVTSGPFDLRSPFSPFDVFFPSRALAAGITKAAATGKLDGDADDMLQAFSKRIHGNGDPVTMDFKDVRTEGVDPTQFPGFMDKVEELRKKGGGTMDISLTKAHRTSGSQREVIGNMTLKLGGKLIVDDKGWKFDGDLGAAIPDHYDFDTKAWGERTIPAEIATRFGSLFKGVDYDIKFRGSKPMRREQTW